MFLLIHIPIRECDSDFVCHKSFWLCNANETLGKSKLNVRSLDFLIHFNVRIIYVISKQLSH